MPLLCVVASTWNRRKAELVCDPKKKAVSEETLK